MATNVCVVGSINMDTVLTVDALPERGQTLRAVSARWLPGGKGANQAVAAARAGAQVRFVGAVGDDDVAATLLRHLGRNGVGTAGVITVPGPSGSAVVTVDSIGENTIVVAAGANGRLRMEDARANVFIEYSQVLLLQLEIPVSAAVDAARVARAARPEKVTVMVNASPAGGDVGALATLAKLADVVIVNEAEARDWSWPVEHLVITRGARGARYTGSYGEIDVPAPEVQAIDTSGAGDVFAGVLAAHWPSGHGYALRRACAAGALATLTAGTGDCAPYADAIDGAVLRD